MNDAVRSEAVGRGVTRLCHVTPFRNLVHIATGSGLLSTALLEAAERRDFNQQDLERLDGYPDHISCSVEYPNAWYLRERRTRSTLEERLFPDWVCVCIDPCHLWSPDTLFCPRNAAADSGTLVRGGAEAFAGLFADQVLGAGGRTWRRTAQRLPSCPTDEQAEVLIRQEVPMADILGLVCESEAAASRVAAALEQFGVTRGNVGFSVCPDLFDAFLLTGHLRCGSRPSEVSWSPGVSSA